MKKFLLLGILICSFSFSIFGAVGNESTQELRMLADAVPGWPEIGDSMRGANIVDVKGNGRELTVTYQSGSKKCSVTVGLVPKKVPPGYLGGDASAFVSAKVTKSTCK
jgi:hypothetical protein